MKKRLAQIITIFSLLTFSAAVTPAFGWADGEGSCYSQGVMMGSVGLSIYHFGAFAAFDYGVHDAISAGAAAGYNGYTFVPQVRTHQIPLMARAAFHPFNLAAIADKINVRDLIDVYAGISTGWIFRWQTTEYELLKGDEASRFSIREYIGMRYYFSEKLAIFVEDCGDLAYIAGGVTYKF